MLKMVELTLPLPANLGNARMHWAQKARAKKEYTRSVGIHVLRQGGWPDEPWEKVKVKCEFFVWNQMDVDNLQARQKWVLDALKSENGSLGYLMDDSPEHLELEEPSQMVDRKQPRVEVRLEKLSGEE